MAEDFNTTGGLPPAGGPPDKLPANRELPDVAALVSEHHAVLYRYAYRLCGAVCDAEDLTQQTFLVAQQKLRQLRDVRHSRGWLFTILRNCYFKTHRQRQPLMAGSIEFNMDAVQDFSLEGPATVQAIDQERLQLALDELPDEFKMVLLLFYFEGCSYKEIAERLSLPPGTVMSRLSRAKGYLRTRLLHVETQLSAQPIAGSAKRERLTTYPAASHGPTHERD